MKANARQAVVVHRDETRNESPLGIFGIPMWIKLSGSDTGGRYAIMEDRTPPRLGPPLHRHNREDESFYVVEGNYIFEVEGKEIPAGPGTSVYAPKGTAHRFQNVGATAGRLLVIVQPAGLDAFFTDIDEATRGAREPDPAFVLPIFEKHGLELLGPPMTPRSLHADDKMKSANAA